MMKVELLLVGLFCFIILIYSLCLFHLSSIHLKGTDQRFLDSKHNYIAAYWKFSIAGWLLWLYSAPSPEGLQLEWIWSELKLLPLPSPIFPLFILYTNYRQIACVFASCCWFLDCFFSEVIYWVLVLVVTCAFFENLARAWATCAFWGDRDLPSNRAASSKVWLGLGSPLIGWWKVKENSLFTICGPV